MRGKKAKRIRKSVYGDLSHKTRKYEAINVSTWKGTVTRVNTGKRREYLLAKKRA